MRFFSVGLCLFFFATPSGTCLVCKPFPLPLRLCRTLLYISLVISPCGLLSYVLYLCVVQQADPQLQQAAGAIVDRFFGEDGYESSDEGGDEETDTETAVGGGEGFNFNFGDASAPDILRNPQQQQQQQLQQPLASLGRGSHLTRPAWMN